MGKGVVDMSCQPQLLYLWEHKSFRVIFVACEPIKSYIDFQLCTVINMIIVIVSIYSVSYRLKAIGLKALLFLVCLGTSSHSERNF